MEFGKVKRDSHPIELAEWNAIIASESNLEQMPDRTGINPFTGEKVVFLGEGRAFYVEDNEVIGVASLEDGEILTEEVPRELCEKIAKSLKADVFEDDR